MRIRKNAKIATVLLSNGSAAERVETHVCQLNQSPWDVMPLSQEPNPSHLLHQFEADDSFTANGSLGDSIGAVESVASMMDAEDKAALKVGDMVINDDDMIKPDKVFDDSDDTKLVREFGLKSDSRSELLKSCSHNGDNTSITGKKGERRRGRARAAKKGSSSASNPYEFYYYSGFGPLWGKRRGERAGEVSKSEPREGEANHNANATAAHQNNITLPTTSSSSQLDNNEDLDYVDDEDEEEEEEENGDSSKKRMRKPVKARSLKSLIM